MAKNWTPISLNKKQIGFLEKISKDCKFSGGRKFSRTAILRALLTAGKGLSLDVNNVKTEKDLKKRILLAFKTT